VRPLTSDVLVIGGGVLGQAAAYHLVREGARVTLIDRADVGQATAAGAGILSAGTTARHAGPPYDLSVRAFNYYPTLMERLASDDAGETGFARCPLLLVAREAAERREFEEARAAIFARQAGTGWPSVEDLHEITPDEARRLFPPLGEVHGAILHRAAGRVDGRLLAQALRRAGERRGLRVRHGSATRLLIERRRVAGAVVDGETLAVSSVVIAGGAWSPAFAAQLGIELPVAPQRGQIIHLRLRDRPTHDWPIISGFRGHYIVAWPEGRIVVGATRETGTGFEPTLTAGGVREVLSEALRVAPGLAPAEIVEMRVGLRPLAADGVPVLGPVPSVEGVYLATGHGPSGLQLGPFSGKVVADAVLGRAPEVDLEPFGVSRFRA